MKKIERVIMAVQVFHFSSKRIALTAPISTLLKLIGIGTVQVTIQEKKIVPILINFIVDEIGAILVDRLRKESKTRIENWAS